MLLNHGVARLHLLLRDLRANLLPDALRLGDLLMALVDFSVERSHLARYDSQPPLHLLHSPRAVLKHVLVAHGSA